MNKTIALCVTAALSACIFAACGGSASSTPASSTPAPSQAAQSSSSAASSVAQQASEKNLADILSAIEAVNPIDNPRDLDDFALENDYGMTMDNIQEFAGRMSNTQGNSGTILVVKAAAGKAADVKKELSTYQQNQVTYWGNYAEFADAQTNAKEGRIVEKGDYVALVFAGTSEADYSAIDKVLDEALS